jgi:hypothetical protein
MTPKEQERRLRSVLAERQVKVPDLASLTERVVVDVYGLGGIVLRNAVPRRRKCACITPTTACIVGGLTRYKSKLDSIRRKHEEMKELAEIDRSLIIEGSRRR